MGQISILEMMNFTIILILVGKWFNNAWNLVFSMIKIYEMHLLSVTSMTLYLND